MVRVWKYVQRQLKLERCSKVKLTRAKGTAWECDSGFKKDPFQRDDVEIFILLKFVLYQAIGKYID